MARAKKTTPLRGKAEKVPTNAPTLKTVVLVWMLGVMPLTGAVGAFLYSENPKPFQRAFKNAEWGVAQATTAYKGWQAKRAAAAAAEEKKRKAAEAAAAAAAEVAPF